VQVNPVPLLVPGEVGIADKPQMGLEAQRREGAGEPIDSTREAACSGVGVGPFEGENVELHGAGSGL
jgi:hypothetical protein